MIWYKHALKSLARPPRTEILSLLEQHVPKDGIVIDASSSRGQFTKLFAQAAPQGHVYAFEPDSSARSTLSKMITTEKLQNVSLFPMGLSDKDSTETPGSGCPVMSVGAKKITLTTLDQFASRHNLKRVDFIRADIGGTEMRFLQGAHQTIDKHRPVLFLATGNDSNAAQKMWNFLKPLSYRINRIENNGKSLTRLDAPVTKSHIWCVAEEHRRIG